MLRVFTLREVAAKDGMGVCADAAVDQKTCEVSARDQVWVANVAQGPLQRTGDADLGQAVGHVMRPLQPAAAGGGQAGPQFRVGGIEAQADDVHGFTREADRDLSAAEVVHAQRQRGVAGALLASQLVMVGQ